MPGAAPHTSSFRDDHMHTDELGRLCMARPHCMALAHGMDARTDAHIQDAAVHTPDCRADTRLRHDMRLDICVGHMQAMRGKARHTAHCGDCMAQHSKSFVHRHRLCSLNAHTEDMGYRLGDTYEESWDGHKAVVAKSTGTSTRPVSHKVLVAPAPYGHTCTTPQ